ncbi:MAG: enoyl-CoA hydratase-related protein [Chthonomonadales bacterium]
MPFTRITLKHNGSVASITLNRPEVHNAFDEVLRDELLEAIDGASIDNSIRAIVIGGTGKSFCAGADLEWMKRMAGYSRAENVKDADRMRAMYEAIYLCPKPIIARVHGAAMGGGAGIVAAAHIAIASPLVTFAFTEVKLGLAPSVISPYVIRKIGPGNASALFATGERFDARTALRIGLIHDLADDLDSAVQEKVKHIVAAGPKGVAKALELVRAWETLPAEKLAPFTVETIADLRASDEGREGIQAFLEKRKPNWTTDQTSK